MASKFARIESNVAILKMLQEKVYKTRSLLYRAIIDATDE